jgi:hypothetical protein
MRENVNMARASFCESSKQILYSVNVRYNDSICYLSSKKENLSELNRGSHIHAFWFSLIYLGEPNVNHELTNVNQDLPDVHLGLPNVHLGYRTFTFVTEENLFLPDVHFLLPYDDLNHTVT